MKKFLQTQLVQEKKYVLPKLLTSVIKNISFLLRKKIESRLSLRHPDKWLPLYSQVTFSHIPYAKSLADGVLQDQVMAPFMARPDIASTWDSKTLEQEILDAWAKAQAAQ